MTKNIDSKDSLKSPNMDYLKINKNINISKLYMDQINALLKECKVEKNDPKTHTSFSPKWSYYIDDNNLENFYTVYSNIITKGNSLSITELPQLIGPWRLDFDFRFDLDSGKKRKYTIEMVKEIVGICQEIITESVHIDRYNPRMIYCILLEKQSPRVENGQVKDGFHLHFPYFWADNNLLDGYFRDKLISICRDRTTFLKEGINNDIYGIIDKVCKKTWLMYGSSKVDNMNKPMESWKISKIFNNDMNEISLEECFEDEYMEFMNEGKKQPLRYYLPKLLSIRQQKIACSLVENVKNKPKRKAIRLLSKTRTMEDALKDLCEIRDSNPNLIEMLSKERASDYNKWMDVGWTLFNIGLGHDMALDMWIEFSKKCPSKFKEGSCEDAWNKMTCGGKTMASLCYMARYDNPDKYKEWRNLNVNNSLMDSVKDPKPTHYGIAKVFYKTYQNQFVCADSKKDIWYEYKNHRWNCVDNGLSLKKLFPEEIRQIYWDFRDYCNNKVREGSLSEEDNGKFQERISKIILVLKDVPFVEKLLKACQSFFYDGKFLQKVDENRDILGFENGVYDFRTKTFRDGSPDDYITMGTGINYRVFDKDDEEVKELNSYLQKVFVNPKLRKFFLDFIFTCVRGCNYNKLFVIFSGGGDNSKSVLVKLLEKTFGDYRVNFPRETFIMGRGASSGSARPELARVRGKRIAFAKELAKNEELNIGMVKEMTGNDSFFARNIYEKGTDINPMFTLICMCNKPPKVPAGDQATWNRIRILPFESLFPKNKSMVPKTEKEQFEKKIFPRDESFAEKLDDLVEPFMWLILNQGLSYNDKLEEPEEVFLATESYKTCNDVYKQFIEDKLEEEKDSSISLVELYQVFKDWYFENYPSYTKEKIGKMTLKTELQQYLGTIGDKNKWLGWKFRTPDEEEAPSSASRKKLLSPIKESKKVEEIKNKKSVKSPDKPKKVLKSNKITIRVEETNDPEEGL